MKIEHKAYGVMTVNGSAKKDDVPIEVTPPEEPVAQAPEATADVEESKGNK